MSLRLKARGVLDQLRAQGVAVRNLCIDSRRVQPGDLFLAWPGAAVDGRRFLADAVEMGAAAVCYEAAGAEVTALSVSSIAVPDLALLAGDLAAEVYGQPSEKLWLCGITGTNGKTSVSQWIARALNEASRPCAVVGTLGNGFVDQLEASLNTTPDAVTLHRDLASFVAAGALACAMEVSSIGLHQGRVNGARFRCAVFTNLSRDHLDYHVTMDEYGEAKRLLFERPGLDAAVINLDDPYGRDLALRLKGRVPTLGYTLGNESGADRVLRAENLTMTGTGQRFNVEGQVVNASVLGRFNTSNLLAVMCALLAAGLSPAEAASALERLRPPLGRMQCLGGEGAPLVVVDYAHTPDALENALSTLRETAAARGGRLLCLFGCGGDRDPGKRPLMGAVAERLADAVLLTSDNPRSESPQAILDEIRAGMKTNAQVEPDRALAIACVIAEAAPQDVVLLAGKGHEPYQEIAGKRLPFSDLDQAKQALEKRP
ncbi:MAG TPA: UDP-N-acetylmuramoyl-L-alanyl-D-glutamate--2,6-diaminopimelate ligase [Rhodocyclaceae bacterium]|nr:UDP-N-acetylmuramoyl-L-alanyl-D-glutamate--2,6-diaminopimelate ligase [Rhodocyclaceae bacterium]